MKKISLLAFFMLVIAGIVFSDGMSNPATVYCNEMGFDHQVIDSPDGQTGLCILPDMECEEWDFLKGKCGIEYNYCSKNGHDTVVRSDGRNDLSIEYAVCVNGRTEIGSVTELIHLSEKSVGKCVDQIPNITSPTTTSNNPAPTSWDWTNHNGGNWMTSVKNQRICGSCWAFSAVGAVEAMINIETKNHTNNPDLSEEYLVSDCHFQPYANQNCCGGSKTLALQFIQQKGGIPDESCLTYQSKYCTCDWRSAQWQCNVSNCDYTTGWNCSDTRCEDRCSDWRAKLVNITDYDAVDETGMKGNITKGPLSVSIGIGYDVGGYWDGDIYRCANDSFSNHAVVVAGYDDVGGYWIVKNSWGTGFGEDGYFKIGYGECYIEESAFNVEVGVCKKDIYQNKTLVFDVLNCQGHGYHIKNSSVTLDCNGHVIGSIGWVTNVTWIGAIIGNYMENVTVKNCILEKFWGGLNTGSHTRYHNILDNTARYNEYYGIAVKQKNTLKNNYAFGNYGHGFIIAGSWNTLFNNYAISNWYNGFNLISSSSNNISYNTARDNSLTSLDNYSGISLRGSRYNNIWYNLFEDNEDSNSYNAHEDSYSYSNKWNVSDMGNTWSDYTAPGSYHIPGPGDGIDHYPSETTRCGSTIDDDTTLTKNLTDCPDNGLNIGSDGITLNCDNHVIDGTLNGNGIDLNGWQDVTVKNCIVQEFDNGVHVSSGIMNMFTNITSQNNLNDGFSLDNNCDSNTFLSNIVSNNGVYGFRVDSSPGNYFFENNIEYNGYGILLDSSPDSIVTDNSFLSNGITVQGSSAQDWDTHMIEFNYINGKPIDYVANGMGMLNPDAAQVILASTVGFFISGLVIDEVNDPGIQLGFSDYNTIDLNTVENCMNTGITLYQSEYNDISNNMLQNNMMAGIYLGWSNDNLVYNNIIQDNEIGIFNMDSWHTTSGYIYDNEFIDNIEQAMDEGSYQWYLTTIGNYWSDFPGNVGYPTYYLVPGSAGNIDWYPTWENHAPEITSLPVTKAWINITYEYDVEAVDIDLDQLTYNLVIHPDDMMIDEYSGLITWIPTLNNTGAPWNYNGTPPASNPGTPVSSPTGRRMQKAPGSPSLGHSQQLNPMINVTVEVTDPDEAKDTQSWQIKIMP